MYPMPFIHLNWHYFAPRCAGNSLAKFVVHFDGRIEQWELGGMCQQDEVETTQKVSGWRGGTKQWGALWGNK
jgi:hypothetical protein